MKNKFIFWQIVGAFVCFALGVLAMYGWNKAHQPLLPAQETLPSAGLLTMDEQELSFPRDAQAPEVMSAQDLPSQLVKIDFPGLSSIQKVGENEEKPEEQIFQPRKPEPVVVNSVDSTVTPQAPSRVVVASDGQSNITLIEVPAEVKLINTLEEYKAFKRTARGKYPDVNFNTQRLAVLQTKGDLPNNVLEVAEVSDVDGGVQIAYRVNVFGLDKKINTHAVTILRKTQKPVTLKQVL